MDELVCKDITLWSYELVINLTHLTWFNQIIQHSCSRVFSSIILLLHLLLLSPFHSRFLGRFSSTHLSWMTHFVADIDECALGGHICHAGQDCDNTIGSYRCVVRCGVGFRRTSDGLSCQGIKMEFLALSSLY